MSQYRKTIYYNTGRKPLFRPGLPPGRPRKMENDDVKLIKSRLSRYLTMLRRLANFS